MTGLLVIGAVVWLAIALFLASFIARRLFKKSWQPLIALALIIVLVPLPLIDEIVGGMQFRQLCKQHSLIRMNPVTAPGRTVYLADLPDVEIVGTWVRVVSKPWQFVDVKTGEPVVSYYTLHASGGWLIHALPVSDGSAPLTFSGFCAPINRPASTGTFKQLGIDYVEPPVKKGD
jgi:hypothetical protein